MGKKRSKVVLKNKNKLVILLVLFTVLGFIGFGTYSYVNFNDQYLEDINSLNEVEEYINTRIPYVVDNNLDFSNLVSSNIDLKVTYKSSNEAVIDNLGRVYRPNYLSNNVQVEIEIIIEKIPSNKLASIYYDFLGGASKTFKITVTVLKAEPSNLEIIEIISKQLYVPSITKSDIGLQDNVDAFKNVLLTWKSNNVDIINNSGKVINTGTASLTAKIEIGEDSKEIDFPIKVVSNFDDIVEIDENFNDVNINGTYDTEYTIGNLVIKGAVINTDNSGKFLRMRAHTNASVEYKNSLSRLKTLSFTYNAITTSAFTNDVFIHIQTSNDNGVNYTNFHSIKVVNNDINTVNIDLSSLNADTKIKILSTANYATMFIAIDNFKVTRDLNETDVLKALNNIIPKNLSTSYLLPRSTPFGGEIVWDSSEKEIFSNTGLLNRPKESKIISLTANIEGVLEKFNLEFNVNVLGTNYVTPVEVFFIDLGKYGDADNGESIYIKIGNIDILVDSGDNMNATKQAISEVINSNSSDKIIDYVIATHPDADHIGSMKYIFDTYDVLNAIYFEGTHTTQLYQSFVTSLQNENLVSECTILKSYNNEGDCTRIIDLAPGVKIEFFDTGYYQTSETNGRSIVFVLEAYGKRLLMTGDADNGSGRTLESNYMNQIGDIDILKVVHHGTKEGTTLEFLTAVDPEYAIITNGNYFGNKHGHPTDEAINRIYQYDSSIEIFAVVGGDSRECTYTTSYKCNVSDRFVDRNGTIKLNIDSNGFTFTSEYNDEMIELSSTHFWKSHPKRKFEYAK